MDVNEIEFLFGEYDDRGVEPPHWLYAADHFACETVELYDDQHRLEQGHFDDRGPEGSGERT